MKKLMSVLLALVFLTGVSLASYDMNGNYSMKFNYVYEEDQNIPQKNSLTFEKVATYVTTGLLIAGAVVLAYLSGSNNSPVPMYDYWANKWTPEACVSRSIVTGYSDYSWVRHMERIISSMMACLLVLLILSKVSMMHISLLGSF